MSDTASNFGTWPTTNDPPAAPAEPTPVSEVKPLGGTPVDPPVDEDAPWVEVHPLDTTKAQPGAHPTPEVPSPGPAEVKLVTDTGVSFFHTLLTLPKHFLDDAGNAVFGRHTHTSLDEKGQPK